MKTQSKLLEAIAHYWSPAQRIARKLRQCQRIAAAHNFTVARGQFGEDAEKFERFVP